MLPEKITFRPGSLAKAMERRCKSDGIKPSKLIREALALHLEVPEPAMDGHVQNLVQYRKKKAKRKRKAAGKRR